MNAVSTAPSAALRRWDDFSPCPVVLVNPPWITKEDNIWHGIKAAMPPLSLLSLAAWLESVAIPTAIIDIHVDKLSAAAFQDRLRTLRPRVLGITVMTATAVASNYIARLAKEVDPEILVVMGGVHAEALPEECLANRAVDAVVRGDGEETFGKLCRAVIDGAEWRALVGISWRGGSAESPAVIHNPPAPVISDLDRLPFPAYHLVPMHKYYPAIGAYRRLPAINMLMTRGCPGKCSFCNSAMTTLRTYDAELVVEEILRLKQAYGIREIQFYDDTFTVMKPNVMKFCRLMIERRVDVSWVAFARADCISDDMAAAMKAAGCHQVLFGVESGDIEMLKRMGKPIQVDKTRRAVKMVQSHGIEVRAAFVYGCEGETTESMQRTLDYALGLDPDLAIFNIATPYPGTQLFQWAKANGHLLHEDWTQYELGRPVLSLPTVPPETVLEYYRRSFQAFYWRPRSIARRIKAARSPSQWIDLARAFSMIMFRHKLGVRGNVREDWTRHLKEDFLDHSFGVEPPIRLTYQLRQENIPLAAMPA